MYTSAAFQWYTVCYNLFTPKVQKMYHKKIMYGFVEVNRQLV